MTINEASINMARCVKLQFTPLHVVNAELLSEDEYACHCMLMSAEDPRTSDEDKPQQWLFWTMPVGRWAHSVGHQSECGIQALFSRKRPLSPNLVPMPTTFTSRIGSSFQTALD